MSGLSHFDDQGDSRMVDVGGKEVTVRIARASGRVRMAAETLKLIRDSDWPRATSWRSPGSPASWRPSGRPS